MRLCPVCWWLDACRCALCAPSCVHVTDVQTRDAYGSAEAGTDGVEGGMDAFAAA